MTPAVIISLIIENEIVIKHKPTDTLLESLPLLSDVAEINDLTGSNSTSDEVYKGGEITCLMYDGESTIDE